MKVEHAGMLSFYYSKKHFKIIRHALIHMTFEFYECKKIFFNKAFPIHSLILAIREWSGYEI